ncbi:unnamed protein product [Nesidiocoris tenuis]|uniref:Tyr recombinase domain-containing protein n=1 Tax=Nesidiocoris tenuis TaxID=355587 RepID=A0A6H5HPJ0_9HEMI|nr:unnamed protein product [Nesidiocoris tenuis]
MGRKQRRRSRSSTRSSSSTSSSSRSSRRSKSYRDLYKEFKQLKKKFDKFPRAESKSRRTRSRASGRLTHAQATSSSTSRSRSPIRSPRRSRTRTAASRGKKIRSTCAPTVRSPHNFESRCDVSDLSSHDDLVGQQNTVKEPGDLEDPPGRSTPPISLNPVGSEGHELSRSDRNPIRDHDYCPNRPEMEDSDFVAVDNDVSLDDDLIDIVGKNPEASTGPSPRPLNEALVPRWRYTLGYGLDKDDWTKLMEKTMIPANLPELIPPAINDEIVNIIPKTSKVKDTSLISLQASLGKGLSALAVPSDVLLSKNNNIPSETNKLLLQHISDSAKLIAHSFHYVSIMRRNLLYPHLNSSVKELTDKLSPSTFLFGNDLTEKIKSVKSIQNAAKDLKPLESFRNVAGPSNFRPTKGGGGGGVPMTSSGQRPGNSNRPARRTRETGQKGRASGQYSNKYRPQKPDYRRRFRKGVFRLRPPRPKYTSTWDPGAVLDFVKSSNESSFKDTSAHLVTLMALATGQRLQTLSLIRLPNIQQETGGVRIFIPDLIKTSRPNAEQPTLWFPFFGKEPSLCVASRILQYLSTSKQFRGSRHDTFLISTTKPFGPASSQTLSRWIRQTMHAAGVSKNFTAHSTRHASTSKAHKVGISFETIRQAAGWSPTSKTFATFYNRPTTADECFLSAVFS